MKKLKKNERIGAIIYILTNNPNNIFTFSYFGEKFNAAKTSISEDITVVKEIVKNLNIGYVETITGANGGVRFKHYMSKEQSKDFLEELCVQISDKSRVIAGGFVFMMDILYSPKVANRIGEIFASRFYDRDIDCVVTIETKGIPIALMTARCLNVPLVIIRKDSKITEGPTVSINYVTGSTKKIQTMSLSKKAMQEGSKVLVIDDFMKAGGTAKGIIDMMTEFKAHVEGIGVFIEAQTSNHKLVDNYISLITLEELNEEKGKIILKTNI